MDRFMFPKELKPLEKASAFSMSKNHPRLVSKNCADHKVCQIMVPPIKGKLIFLR